MQRKLTSLNTSTQKNSLPPQFISKQNFFLAKQNHSKQVGNSNFEKQQKMQSLINFSKQEKAKLARCKLRKHFDDTVKVSDWLQRDSSINSSNFRRGKLKNQTRDETRSNRFLLNILLSQVPDQPKKQTKMLKQIQNQYFCQGNSSTQQKLKGFFADLLKVKKYNEQQSQVVTPKKMQSKDCIFRKKHMVHHTHQLAHLFEKRRKNLSKRELSMVCIKKYPFSHIKLVDKSEQLPKVESLNVSRVVSNDQSKRQKSKLLELKKMQHKNSIEGICMQPWKTKDERVQIQIDQFI